MKNKRIAIVGATGRVGREILSILCEMGISLKNISAIASKRSEGKVIEYGSDLITVQNLEKVNFSKYDLCLFSAGAQISEKYAPIASGQGAIVIDNTSCFRMNNDIPLIVPEVNLEDLKAYDSKIISNPNCSTIQMVMVLKPLHDEFKLTDVIVSTYQSVSGAGQKGVDELVLQMKQIFDKKEVIPKHFKTQIAFNLIPQIDEFTDDNYTKEEMKMMNETKKILKLPNLNITATCVRAPVIVGHAISVFAKFKEEINLKRVMEVLNGFNGVTLVDDPKNYRFATPIDAASKNDVFVSRMRKHPTIDSSISFWCVADNIRKGAALNAIQIAKRV
ncbi:MAG: aspartate-semialdehyde dehydrogenase [Holosporales bacterium]|jgi:aspartate-semialdehyde dehydrogenase|nr:aspartate-semialdehyde dehydrogenase [Holosporales bacterium]